MRIWHRLKPTPKEQKTIEVKTLPSLIEMEVTVDKLQNQVCEHEARLNSLEKTQDRVVNKLDKLIWLILAVLAEVPIMVVI